MFSTKLPLKYQLAYLVGAWYWLVMLVILSLILIRMTLWVIFRSITGVKMMVWVPLLFEYLPIYVVFLSLPVVSFETKVVNIIAPFTFFPTYLSVFWGWLWGRLDPSRYTSCVKGSCEAFGDSWPRLANFNIAFLFFITLVFCQRCMCTKSRWTGWFPASSWVGAISSICRSCMKFFGRFLVVA